MCSKTNSKPKYILLIVLFSFHSYLLSAAETSRSNKASENSTSESNGYSQPKLTSYSPMPCVAAGSSFTLHGSNFDHLKAADGEIRLFADLNGVHQAIKYQQKNNERLSVAMPSHLENIDRVRFVLSAEERREIGSIEIKVCRSAHSNESESNDRTTSTQQKPQTKPDGERPETHADDSNSVLRKKIAAQQSEGSLLGTALPSIPQVLRLRQNNDSSAYVNNELIAVSSDIEQAKQLAKIMSGFKARTVRRKTLKSLGLVLTTFRLAPGTKVVEVLAQIANRHPKVWIDLNHFYYGSANKSKTKKQTNVKLTKKNNRRTNLFKSIGFYEFPQCNFKTKIGILDGPVDQKVASLVGQSIVQKQMFSRGKKSASFQHGTAVASLIVGSSKFPDLAGVLNQAELVVGVVMQVQPNNKKKIFSTTESLILGLNWLVEQRVQVINLSLGGPRNGLLELALEKVLALDIGVVAAAGNGGEDGEKSYPAAQPDIIAVSAVDSEANLAEDATQGDYIDLSAPGVDLWVADKQSEGHYQSGSSLAAPLVAAALARLGGSTKKAIQLFKISKDLGETGKDPKFGWGLLQFPPCNNSN